MMKYIGGGYLAGVPARDLTADEVRKYGRERLLKSGLYIEVRAKSKRSEAAETVTEGQENG